MKYMTLKALAAGLIAATTTLAVPALARDGNKSPPIQVPAGTRVGPENPCNDGFSWVPDAGLCVRRLEPALAEKAKCRPGDTREVIRRDGRKVVQICGFVK